MSKEVALTKKGSNHLVSSEFDEIADNIIVDIYLNIVVGDEAGPYGLQNNQEVHFNIPVSERKLKKFHWISIIGYGYTNNIFYDVAQCLDCGNKLKTLQTKKLCMYFEMALVCLNSSKKNKKFRSFDLN